MGYLITQIIICLLIAAMIGFFIGWLLRGLTFVDKEETTSTLVKSPKVDTSFLDEEVILEPIARAPALSHGIEKIEGIDKDMVKILHKNGIETTKDLIAKCSSKHGLERIVNSTEVIESTVKQWVSMADLMRISDINGKTAQLIEACGIKSTSALANVDSQALIDEMKNVNQRENIMSQTTPPLPDLNKMNFWIREAKTFL